MTAEVERVHAETRAQWRAWLEQHGHEAKGVWLVSWLKRTGRPAVPYAEAVTEALAFGWVDSKGNKLDDERTMLYFAPRKRGILEWIVQAKRPATRADRIEQTARLAGQGQRAGQWRRPAP